MRSEATRVQPRILGIGGTLRTGSRSRAALEHALAAAEEAGGHSRLLALAELDLPMFRPRQDLDEYPASVRAMLEAVRQADGLLWSTAGYHGTLAGVTKNALDYLEFLADEQYLNGRPVGLIAVAGGSMAAVNAIDAMVHTAHALRGSVLPLKVPIGRARRALSPQGQVTDSKSARRLDMLGQLVLEQARSWRAQQAEPRIEEKLARASA